MRGSDLSSLAMTRMRWPLSGAVDGTLSSMRCAQERQAEAATIANGKAFLILINVTGFSQPQFTVSFRTSLRDSNLSSDFPSLRSAIFFNRPVGAAVAFSLDCG